MFTPELLALAPGYSMRAAGAPRPPRRKLHQGTVLGVVQLLGSLDKAELVRAREQINKLAGDDQCGEIVIIVDSPGGTVSGTHDLHSAIVAAAEVKRVTAVAEDLCASGGYYAISGASEICVNTTGMVGSIGVYQVLTDASNLISKNGIEVLVIRAGNLKGTGVFGAKISAEEIAHIQSLVDAQAGHFVAAVARGRKLSVNRVKDLADGRLFVGNQAIAAGLVDRIATVEDVLAEAEVRLRKMIYAQLEGAEATSKFDELAAEFLQVNGFSDSLKHHAEKCVAAEHPTLAAKVQSIRDEDAAKAREHSDRKCRLYNRF